MIWFLLCIILPTLFVFFIFAWIVHLSRPVAQGNEEKSIDNIGTLQEHSVHLVKLDMHWSLLDQRLSALAKRVSALSK